MYHEHHHFGLFFFRIVEIIFTINLLLLDAYLFRSVIFSATSPIATEQIPPTATPSPTSISVTQTPAALDESPSPVVVENGQIKEVFISLGQGQTTATDWTDVPGAQVSVDSTKYTNIKQIVFEASLQNQNNQIAWVRLYDKTTNHPVWYTEMNTNALSQFLTSPSMQLDSGNNVYQVQMKTQLQYPVALEQARIHITLQ